MPSLISGVPANGSTIVRREYRRVLSVLLCACFASFQGTGYYLVDLFHHVHRQSGFVGCVELVGGLEIASETRELEIISQFTIIISLAITTGPTVYAVLSDYCKPSKPKPSSVCRKYVGGGENPTYSFEYVFILACRRYVGGVRILMSTIFSKMFFLFLISTCTYMW